jgi:hypothetical protein
MLSDCRATIAPAPGKNELRRDSSAPARVSSQKLRLAVQVLTFLVALLDCGAGYAKSYMSEFLNYQTICSVVEVKSGARLEERFDRDFINRSTALVCYFALARTSVRCAD